LLLLLLLLKGQSKHIHNENLALRGKATQSNLINNPWASYSAASNAIDGNRESRLDAGSCSCTDSHAYPWWRVDLLDTFIITSIIITNRGDCCPERLNGAQVYVGNSLEQNGAGNPLAGVISHIPAGESLPLSLTRGMEGRYVTVRLPRTGHLTLCEVEVYGNFISADFYNRSLHAGENVALQGKATQSSTHSFGVPYNAIDGNRDSTWEHASCSHTQAQLNPWWRLDLITTHKVFSVNVTNRNIAPHELNGAEIRIGNSLENNGNNNPRCAVISHIPPGFTYGFQCHGMEGRYVNIVNPGTRKHVIMCEVEVYGSSLD
uniref:Si:ch211-215k15.4 n=1 Tax=Myripristis murdjan TaxID=586833 RepID=A0A667XQ03_9TELE